MKRRTTRSGEKTNRNYTLCRFLVLALAFALAIGVTTAIAIHGASSADKGSLAADKESPATDAAPDADRTLVTAETPNDAESENLAQPGNPFPIEREPTTVKLMAVGDNLMHNTVVNAGLQDDGTYDFTGLYRYMLDDIQGADIACINQETPYINDPNQYSNYPCFGGPTAIGDALAEVGFDLVTHATNHTWDKGEEGFYDTFNFWKDNHPEVTVLGIHDSQADAQKIKTVTRNGITIACLNYTYGLNGFVASEDWMIDLLDDKDRIAQDIQKAKACSDIVIVFAHWGTEYVYEPTEEQVDWAQFFADQGVGAVIGGHPHVLEPVRTLTGKDGNKMVCFYSLGNYISHQSYYYQMLGGMAGLTITKDDSGTYVSDYSLTPTMTMITYGNKGKEFAVVKLDDYTDELAATHLVPETSPEHMWQLYHEIVDEEDETADAA